MSTPLACAICLVDGRPEMTRRAVESFYDQTYENKRLMLFDTGADDCTYEYMSLGRPSCRMIVSRHFPDLNGKSIGELRNLAIEEASSWWQEPPDVIVHMDSDDLSHPRRIEEQVALLESSGAEAVGYHEAIFWDERLAATADDAAMGVFEDYTFKGRCEAYLYSNPRPNYAIGASLAYWRSTWEPHPFPHLPIPGNRQSAGEDAQWLKDVKCVAISGVTECSLSIDGVSAAGVYHQGDVWATPVVPRLICSVHGGNSQMYELSLGSPQFRRAEQWDDYCRAQMRLEGK